MLINIYDAKHTNFRRNHSLFLDISKSYSLTQDEFGRLKIEGIIFEQSYGGHKLNFISWSSANITKDNLEKLINIKLFEEQFKKKLE